MQQRPSIVRWIGVSVVAVLSATGLSTTASAQSWTDQDVGSVGQPAPNHSVNNGIWTVQGAGADIWSTADGFHFVYQQLTGDGQIVVKVDSVGNTNTFAKAGVMMRNGTNAGDAHVILDLRPNGAGSEFMKRASTNGSTTFIAGTSIAAPYWLKLVRSGGSISGYQSTDGNTWTLVGTTTDTLNAGTPIDVGLVVCSHDTTTLNTSTFESPAVSSLGGIPTSYTAITTRDAKPKPTLPTLGSAGYKFTDPTFGSQILRVTDQNTRPSTPGKSYRVLSNSHANVWNADSTKFVITSTDGNIIPFSFDGSTMTASRISGPGDGGLIFNFIVEPQFSKFDPNVIFGVSSGAQRVLTKYTFPTGYSNLLDLDTVVATSGFVGGIATGGAQAENLLTFFGGTQGTHHYALWFPVATPDSAHWKLLDTCTLHFSLHAASVDRSGQYVFLFPEAYNAQKTGSCDALQTTAQVYIWDTATDVKTPVTVLPTGHDASGYGYWINQACCTGTSWDAGQWQFRSLANLSSTSDMINPVLTPKVTYMADHESWSTFNSSTQVASPPPVFMSTYRFCPDCPGGTDRTADRAWDEEIIGMDTTQRPTPTVWRFAHHRSDVVADNGQSSPGFWYEPTATVSPNGLWIAFTSNWEKTLGTDANQGDPATTHREDVFIVQLTPGSGGGGGGGGAVTWTNTVNATANGNSLQKTGGCDGCQNAGGVSSQSIASGTGSVTFGATVNATPGPSMYVGLGNALGTPPQYTQFAYSISISPNNGCDIREFGVWKADCSWTSTDVFKIAIESDGKVHFYKGSTPLYTSTSTPGNYPYVLGADLFNVGVSVNNAVLTTP